MDSKEIELLYKEIESLTLMISNMSSMISASSEKEQLQIKEFSLEKRLHTIESGLRPQFEKKQITFTHDIQEGIMMHSDPNLLSQIVYNILTNAQKYTEEGGAVSLGCKEEGNNVRVWVTDNGIGMSKETLSHVFEAYYRSADVVALKGEGIGLYLVKQQLERLKGSLEIDSELHKGSTFTLSFPKNLQKNGQIESQEG
jgi:signal transduction histidine kinase